MRQQARTLFAPLAVVVLSIVGALGGPQVAGALGLAVAPSACFTPAGAEAVAHSSQATAAELAKAQIDAEAEAAQADLERAARLAELAAQLEESSATQAERDQAEAELAAELAAEREAREQAYADRIEGILDGHQAEVQGALLEGLEAGLETYVAGTAQTAGAGGFLGALGLFAISEFRRRRLARDVEEKVGKGEG